MKKKVRLLVDRGSWTAVPAEYRHPFPSALGSSTITNVDVLGSLLNIGIMTIPPGVAAACSLAGYWAHVRYSAAIDDGSEYLQLRREWEELDSHQKTILSDDWGMGFTTYWLTKRFKFQRFCDGRYFINRLNGLGVASVDKLPTKRGTYKSPDFIFEDSAGRFHLVECKGNQQGEAHLNEQLSDGVAQKRNIKFNDEKNEVGQRIVAGFYVSPYNSRELSALAIRDPAPERGSPVVTLTPQAVPFLHDTVERGDVARNFQLIGAPEIAESIMGSFDRHERSSVINVPDAISSLERALEKLPGTDLGWLGRVVEIPFPFSVKMAGRAFQKARIIHAVNQQFLNRVRNRDTTRKLLAESFGNASLSLNWLSRERQRSARISRGNAFFAEITLLP